LTKYTKCNVWRLAVRYVIYIYNVSRLRDIIPFATEDINSMVLSHPWAGSGCSAMGSSLGIVELEFSLPCSQKPVFSPRPELV